MGVFWKNPGDEVERLMNTPQASEHHGFDGFPDREVPPGRVLMRGSVEDVAQAEFVEHARHNGRGGPTLGDGMGFERASHLL